MRSRCAKITRSELVTHFRVQRRNASLNWFGSDILQSNCNKIELIHQFFDNFTFVATECRSNAERHIQKLFICPFPRCNDCNFGTMLPRMPRTQRCQRIKCMESFDWAHNAIKFVNNLFTIHFYKLQKLTNQRIRKLSNKKCRRCSWYMTWCTRVGCGATFTQRTKRDLQQKW